MLFVRPLAEDTEILQPATDASRHPPIAVAADDQLMPRAPAGMPRHRRAECFRGFTYRRAVCFRRSGIEQWLMLDVAAVANEMSEQHQAMIRPFVRLGRLRHAPRQCQPVALLDL